MGRLHVLVVRHASVHFAPQRNPALRAEPEALRPFNDRVRPCLDADLVEPGVARFGESLNEEPKTNSEEWEKKNDEAKEALIAFLKTL